LQQNPDERNRYPDERPRNPEYDEPERINAGYRNKNNNRPSKNSFSPPTDSEEVYYDEVYVDEAGGGQGEDFRDNSDAVNVRNYLFEMNNIKVFKNNILYVIKVDSAISDNNNILIILKQDTFSTLFLWQLYMLLGPTFMISNS
jgi:hypothetical protein